MAVDKDGWSDMGSRTAYGYYLPPFGWLIVRQSADKSNPGWIAIVFDNKIPNGLYGTSEIAKQYAIAQAKQYCLDAIKALEN